MSNVFLLYMPLGNAQAMVHYEDTIKNRVSLARISPFVSQDVRATLVAEFRAAPIPVWGSEAGPRNLAKFDSMRPGDDILIVEGDHIRLMGKIAAKVRSSDLSRTLWQTINGQRDTTWSLIYFIANPRDLDLPFKEFNSLFGYAPDYRLRGFTSVSAARIEQFYMQYDDLYSVLERIQLGKPVARKTVDAILLPDPIPDLEQVSREDIEEILQTPLISDHVRMQWTLARLGIKAGEKVWVPVADRSRLKQTYDFGGFDPEFTAGVDLPPSYLENIDVVWKQQFRIGAAYEIENSTSIYSGLLRFADLNIVAPNTLYPMFVVAPRERKNQLRKQLQRPAFQKLEIDSKVRFLPYEEIEKIDAFFANSTAGLSVDLIVGKSESVI